MATMRRRPSKKQRAHKQAKDRDYRKQKNASLRAEGIKCRTIYLNDAEYADALEHYRQKGIEAFSAIKRLERLTAAKEKLPPKTASEDPVAKAGVQLFFPEVNASK